MIEILEPRRLYSTASVSVGNIGQTINALGGNSAIGASAALSAATPALASNGQLTGTPIGTSGSYNNNGNTINEVFDSNLSTFFDAPTAGTVGSPNWVGLDLGSASTINSITYAPRVGFESRMVGGSFQASNSPTFGSGVVTLATITTTPPDGYTTISTSATGSYRYVRYVAPVGGYGNIAELQIFGTPGFTPTVITPPSATLSAAGTTAALSVAASETGNPPLTYTWSAATLPTGVTASPSFSSANGTTSGSAVTATFAATGVYGIQVKIADPSGNSIIVPLSVPVGQVLTSIVVTPSSPVSVPAGGAQLLGASGLDQFGLALATQPAFTWSIANGGSGTINSSTGVYTASTTVGSTATVTASSGLISGSAQVTTTAAAPTVTSVTTTTANGTYSAGTDISVSVTFNQPIVVTGNPLLTLNTGAVIPSQTSMLTPATGGTYNIGFIGDSITTGVYDSGVSGADAMVADLNAEGVKASEINEGHNGSTTFQWAPGTTGSLLPAAITAFEAANVNTVCIMLGTNDCKEQYITATTDAQYVANMTQIVAALHAAGIANVIINEPPHPTPGADGGVWTTAAIPLIDQYIASLDTIPGAIIGDRTAYQEFEANPQLQADGIHPNQAGYNWLGAAWAAAFVAAIPPASSVTLSPTQSLTFNYNVAPGQNTSNLDVASASALSLNGGTITSTLGGAADLVLPTSGAAGSLAASSSIAIDTTGPAVTLNTPAIAGSTLSFSGTGGLAAGDLGNVSVNLYAGSLAVGTPLQTLTCTRDPTTGAYSVTVPSPLSLGVYTVQAAQADAVGNKGVSPADTFVYGPNTVQLIGTPSANTTASYNNVGNTYLNVFDGNASTFFDSPLVNGDWVQLDLGSAQTISDVAYAPRLAYESNMDGGIFEVSNDPTFSSGVVLLYTVNSPPNDGLTLQPVSPGGAYRYLRYVAPPGSSGNIAEMQVFGPAGTAPLAPGTPTLTSSTSTTATIAWTASASSGVTGYDILRNGSPIGTTSSTTLSYTDSTLSPSTSYSYAIEAIAGALYSPPSAVVSMTSAGAAAAGPLTGTPIGTSGSYDGTSTIAKVFDGNLNTFFDAPTAGTLVSPDWVGLDLGSASTINSITYAPRVGFESRMNGGSFQASTDPNFGSGVVTLATITATPADGYTTISVSATGSYRYVRYVAPVGGYGNIAELQFAGTPGFTPTVVTPPSANLSAAGTTAALSVAASETGNPPLTYTWSAATLPTGVTASPTFLPANGTTSGNAVTATFAATGVYGIQVKIADPSGNSIIVPLSVTVGQVLTSIAVSPATPATVNAGATRIFSATAMDQFGLALATQPVFTWSIANGGSGTINSATGAYTASSTIGSTATVVATSGLVSGTASVTATAVTSETITSVTSTAANGIYDAASTISVKVNFSEPIEVTGDPLLTLNTGAVIPSQTGVLTPPTNGTYNIGFIGDSITAGYLDSGTSAADAMVADLNAQGIKATEANKGYSGSTSSQWVPGVTGSLLPAAIAAFQAANVNTVCVMLGTNDCKAANITPSLDAQYVANMTQIVAALHAAGIANVIIDEPLYVTPGSFSGSWTAASVPVMDQFIASLDTIPGAIIGDRTAYREFQANPQLLADGIHPNQAGYNWLGGAWAAAFAKLVSSASASPTAASQSLTFTYNVAQGQNTSNLDLASTSALSLNGGTITDTSGNAANLTLPAPGTAGSLGADSSIAIDTVAPVVTLATPVASTSPVVFSGTGALRAGDSATVSIYIYSGAQATGTPVEILSTTRDAVTGAYSISVPSSSLPVGFYTALAGQQDADGNSWFSAASPFNVGTNAFSGIPSASTVSAYGNSGNTYFNVFDGNTNTFFDSPNASGNWVQLNFNSPQTISAIAFAPRVGLESRMEGGIFEASNDPTFTTGVVTLYTVPNSAPSDGLTTQAVIVNGSYQYFRYVAPAGSYGNIAEMQVIGAPPAITGTPQITPATTSENTQTSTGLVLTASGSSTAYYQIGGITNGLLYQGDGVTPITNGQFITVAQGAAGLKFTPTQNLSSSTGSSFSFSAQASTTSGSAGLGGGVATASITVNAVAHTPSITPATTTVGTQSTGGLVITANSLDATDTNLAYQITGITNGTLTLSDGVTPVINGQFITAAQGAAGLDFTPASALTSPGSSFGFSVQASVDGTLSGLGGSIVPASITVNPPPAIGIPLITPAITNEDTQTSSGLVITPGDPNTVAYQISGITNGTLFQSDGVTPITNGEFITLAQGSAGLIFTPGSHLTSAAGTSFSFSVQASTTSGSAGLGGSAATASITVNAVAHTPSITAATTSIGTQSTSGLVITANSLDASDANLAYQITGITDGTLTLSDGVTPVISGQFITAAQGAAGLDFTPTSGLTSPSSSFGFAVQASADGTLSGLGGSIVPASVTVNPLPATGTPLISPSTTTEDTHTTSGLAITPSDPNTVAYQISGITNGTLFQSDGVTPITNGEFITLGQGAAGLIFMPGSHLTSAAGTSFSFSAQASTTSGIAGLGGGVATASITVNPVAHTPSMTPATTTAGKQSTSGLAISANALDASDVNLAYQITGITNGTLTLSDGVTAVINGQFITAAQGAAGLDFTPASGLTSPGSSFGFSVQASVDGTLAGLGGSVVPATITVNPAPAIGIPLITPATTSEDTPTSSGLVITPGDPNTVAYQITAITNGSLFQSDGVTPITNGEFITVAQGSAGLVFTPGTHMTSAAGTSFSFNAQASTTSGSAGLGGSVATASITVNPIAHTPSVTPATTTAGTQSNSGLVITANPLDASDASLAYRITGITNGTLFLANGATPVINGQFITAAQGAAGLDFTPAAGLTSPSSSFGFSVQASINGTVGGLGGTIVAASITVNQPAAGKLTGTASANTTASWNNTGTTYANVFDGNTNTFFDAPTSNGNWVQLDLGSAHTLTAIAYAPRVGFESRMIGGIFEASNDPTFNTGAVNLFTISTSPVDGLTSVPVNLGSAYRYVRYVSPAGSYGNIAEMQVFGPGGTAVSAPNAPGTPTLSSSTSTTATIAWAASTSTGVTGYLVFRNGTQIGSTSATALTYPDSGLNASTTYSYTVEAVASGVGSVASGALSVTTPPSTATNGQLTGIASANTTSSYGNTGATYAKVFDGYTNTFFDAPTANGNWVQLDLGAAHTITSIAYAPRVGFESRMIGGMFEASNDPTFATGVVSLFTVATAPPDGLTPQAVSTTGTYRYIRYVSPAGSYGNIAEMQVLGR